VSADDLYGVLGLKPRASREQVERAYRFQLELYGDGSLATYSLVDPGEAERQRARIREAYHVLADSARRREYDERLGLEPPGPPVLPFPAPAAPAAQGAPEAAAEPPEVVTGEALRGLREARGVSLREISSRSKIGVRFLEYIEQDRFEFLPANVYLRGFLQEYARAVGLDPRRTAEAYIARVPRRS
jgi:flagellar biosynthesis protein FlhG